MKNNIVKVIIGKDMYHNNYYWATYVSGCERSYRNTSVPKSVLDFIKSGCVNVSSRINRHGDKIYTYTRKDMKLET